METRPLFTTFLISRIACTKFVKLSERLYLLLFSKKALLQAYTQALQNWIRCAESNFQYYLDLISGCVEHSNSLEHLNMYRGDPQRLKLRSYNFLLNKILAGNILGSKMIDLYAIFSLHTKRWGILSDFRFSLCRGLQRGRKVAYLVRPFRGDLNSSLNSFELDLSL